MLQLFIGHRCIATMTITYAVDNVDRVLSDGRRLAACWNACALIPTDSLEADVVAGLERSLQRIADEGDERSGLIAERALVSLTGGGK